MTLENPEYFWLLMGLGSVMIILAFILWIMANRYTDPDQERLGKTTYALVIAGVIAVTAAVFVGGYQP